MAKKIKIAIDDGHGALTPGKSTPDGYRENRFNKAVGDYLNTILKRCGFDTLLTAPGDADASLKSRTDKANTWGADALVSLHYNALKDYWRDGEGGIETFHYPGSTSGKKLAEAIHKEITKGTKLKDRGVKSSNLHMLRESNMPAALPEFGFMDIKKEAELMKSAAYQKECATETAKGLCNYFNKKYVEEAKPVTKPVKKPVTAPKETGTVGTVTVLVDQLWYYDKPDWDAKKDQVKKGEVFTVVGELTVNGSKMLKLKSGNYLTANSKYVKYKKK